jgi:hypothetical protein
VPTSFRDPRRTFGAHSLDFSLRAPKVRHRPIGRPGRPIGNQSKERAMKGTTSGKLKPDPITEEVRSRYGPHLQSLGRIANESLAAGNFAGAAGYFRSMALSCEQAANEQNKGWILQACAARNDGVRSW